MGSSKDQRHGNQWIEGRQRAEAFGWVGKGKGKGLGINWNVEMHLLQRGVIGVLTGLTSTLSRCN